MAKTTKNGKGNKNVIIGAIIVVVVLVTGYMLFISFSGNESKNEKKPFLSTQELYKFKKEGELTFRSPEGEFISNINIEIAETPEETSYGLMDRMHMAENQGMLFIFEDEAKRGFFMKNTLIPLDMLFVNADNKIVSIKKNATPLDETSISSGKPAKYVVEVNAGYTDKHNINVGDEIVWRRI